MCSSDLLADTTDITFARTTAIDYLTLIDPTTPKTVMAGGTYTIKVRGFDKWGSFVGAGATINWTCTTGTLAAATSLTDADGYATIVFTPSTVAGTNATITATGSGSVTSSVITTIPNSTIASCVVTGPSTAVAGVPVTYTAQVYDAYGNHINYHGSTTGVTVTGPMTAVNGTEPTLPTSITFVNGTGTFQITFVKVGTNGVGVGLTSPSLYCSGPGSVVVSAGILNYYTVTGFGTTQTVGVAFSATVNPFDAYGNLTVGGTFTLQAVTPTGSGSINGNLLVVGSTAAPTGLATGGSTTVSNMFYTYPETIRLKAVQGVVVSYPAEIGRASCRERV